MSKKYLRPTPILTNAINLDDKYIAAICPACGKYPGDEGWQVCQYCDRWVEAYCRWEKKKKKNKKGWFW